MPDFQIEQEYVKEKIRLVQKVNYVTSALAILFGFICIFLLNIREIIPQVLFSYSILNLINIFFYENRKNKSLTYNISFILALISALTITLYSGGINSTFI